MYVSSQLLWGTLFSCILLLLNLLESHLQGDRQYMTGNKQS
jgi:hypothetical protein